jgi:solute carrier family 45 protein 1/2/4
LFLSGQDSDEEDGDEGEGLKRAERGRMFNHPGALLSTDDVGQIDGNRYDPVPRQEANGRRAATRSEGNTLSSKAGIILVRRISRLFTDSATSPIASKLQGIHNIFVVIPQFLVTGFSAVLFALIDPQKPTLPGHHIPTAPHPGPATNITVVLKNVTDVVVRAPGEYMLAKRTESADTSHTNSVVYIFRYVLSGPESPGISLVEKFLCRIGGIAASIAFVLCWRLAKEIRHR